MPREKKVVHGGAWKVAYADFATAMMALFLVLWLMNSSQKVLHAVGPYFRDPVGTAQLVRSGMGGRGASLAVDKNSLSRLKEIWSGR